MKKKVKKVWVKALENGRLSDGRRIGQTEGKLTDGQDNFCCLGVLCEEAVLAGVIKPAKVRESVGETGALSYGKGPDDAAILPDAVIKWAGLEGTGWDTDPEVTGETGDGFTHTTNLSSWNDEHGATFGEIAKMVKKSL